MSNDWFGSVDPVPTEDSRTHWLARQTSEFIREMTTSGRPWHARLEKFEMRHTLRGGNKTADRLANEVMDHGMGRGLRS